MRIESKVKRIEKSSNVYPDKLEHYYNQVDDFILLDKKSLKTRKSSSSKVKRLFDLTLCFLAIPFLLPLITAIAILIRLDSKGEAVFVQDRMGKDFKNFKCYKFRTMHIDSANIFQEYLEKNKDAYEEWKNYKKLRNYDPRITRIGKFLRKTSLDELPQIFNVIKGDMSLIGPRPYLPEEEIDMRPYSSTILSVTPGITGLWQVSGRNKLTFEERLKLDSWYALNRTLGSDILLLIKTIKVVLLRDGAY